MKTDDLKELLKAEVPAYGLPWEAVYAFVMTESSGNEYAMRHEPQYKWLFGHTHSPTERMGQMTSWGLMQVMGAVAREYGFSGHFPALCDPKIGLQYGMKHLKKYYNKHQNWPDTIAAYNAGHPKRIDGKYENQAYVDKVLAVWSLTESQIPLKATEA